MIRRRGKHGKLLAADEFTSNRDIKLHRDCKAGCIVASLGHSGDAWQVYGRQQVTGRIVSQSLFANLYFFASLSHDNHARLIGDVARGSGSRPLVQCQARNGGSLLLCLTDQSGNSGGQLNLQFLRPVRLHDSSVTSVCHESRVLPFRITVICARRATAEQMSAGLGNHSAGLGYRSIALSPYPGIRKANGEAEPRKMRA